MTRKIFKNIFISCLAVLASTIIIIFGVMYRFYGNELMDELHAEVNTVSVGVEQGGISYLKSLAIEDEKRITWVSRNGTIKFDTDASADKMENHLNRQEIKEALAKGTGEAIRTSDTLSERTMYCAKQMKDGSVIRVSTNQYTIWILLLNMIQPLFVVIFITLVLSYLVAYFASKKIVEPINQIDLENVDSRSVYEELEPLIEKIRTQNTVIRRQIKDLKRAQAEFSAITGNMKEGLVVVDSKGSILSYNKSAEKLLNPKSKKETAPAGDLQIDKKLSGYIESSLYGEHISEIIEYGDCWLELLCNPVSVDGKIKGAVAVIFDVTEKHQREDLRREFSANVSHELKTPLAAILASSEVIEMDATPKETDRHFAGNIIKECNRLIALVNDIIKLSKLDSNSIEPESEEVDLHATAAAVAESLTPIAESCGVRLLLYGEKTVVTGVPAILYEIIYNLVDNAVKYNREGGSVTVTVVPVNGKAKLIVKDTGIGVSPENRERIFERFYRVDKSHSKEVGGTGLGLSIVKHGVEYHNGRLHIESKVGKGTEITVEF